MPVKIRLARHGRKQRPYYHIVVADGRSPRDGKFIERIGSYNPCTNPASIELDFDKALSWMLKGAQPSDTARAILRYEGVLMKKHLLEGVKKGAFDEATAESRFEAWKREKEAKIQAKVDTLASESSAEMKKRLDAETKIKEERAAVLAKKNSELAEDVETEDEEAVAEVTEETTDAAPEEAKAEEAPEEEVKEEPAAEVKEETPEAKAEEAPVEETKEETKE